ncbi:hypothetical protein [Streptomyces marincola]|uniref:hypothetical protein n=1 Tax=Streptomyces marincola TaxID=2878388 RepID=UPI001CF1960D|nr:hypothetical protein [Streptomyces marincola]UCM88251.1 hypothetical protein LC193_09940 [Streptomyces marincola]
MNTAQTDDPPAPDQPGPAEAPHTDPADRGSVAARTEELLREARQLEAAVREHLAAMERREDR